MTWTNYGLLRYKKADINNFTTSFGIRIRRAIYPPLRFVLGKVLGGKIHVESYPKLERKQPYIFIATHSFVDEVQLILSTLDRNAYSLIGTTDQLEHNPMIYANWLTGIIYVNRFDKESRRSSIPKMKKILDNGSSVLIFPEGGWNNTENLPCMKLFASPYILAKESGCNIIPLSCFYRPETMDYYISVGDPVDVSQMEKDEALSLLRDHLSTLWWNLIESHSEHIQRSSLRYDCRLYYMHERCCEYLKTKWTKDTFDEELTQYIDKRYPPPQEIRASFDKVKITPENAKIFSEILVRREEDKKYDFKTYMHENWNKSAN